jgi:hypothetical protein
VSQRGADDGQESGDTNVLSAKETIITMPQNETHSKRQ